MTATPEERNAARFAALADLKILDTDPEPSYDDIVRVAAYICGTPISTVTLVAEDRQWFKAALGLTSRQSPIETSFCKHALDSQEIMIVPDAREDARFATNPLVLSDPHIRFYAGAPLITSEGIAVGTLCVIDRISRSITSDQQKALIALAHQVNILLELRRKNQQLADLAKSHAEARAQIERQMDEIQRETDQRERAEILQHESELRFRSIFRSANTGIAVADEDFRIVQWNRAAEIIFGYKERQIAYQDLTTLVTRSCREALRQGLLASRTPASAAAAGALVLTGVRSDGSEFPLEISLAAWHAQGAVFFSGIMQDITQRKAVERMKDEFVSTVSHELRTPLTGIRGSLGIITAGMAGEVPPDVRKLSEIALQSTERLVRLVNDMLDIEKISSGNAEYHITSTSLGSLIDEAIEESRPYAAQFFIELAYPGLQSEIIIQADRDRIIQVLTNLISNAVKASRSGQTVTIDASMNEARARIAVMDNGAGIPPEFRDRIFQRFAQADSSDTRKKSGTGLGLSIAREIARHHGGDITFESVSGEGTTFTVDLPLAPVQTA